MTEASRSALVTKDAILSVLSDEETARVSTAEAAKLLHDGAEYIDLEHLDQGVQKVSSSTQKPSLATVIPKSAVSKETWAKIVAYVKH